MVNKSSYILKELKGVKYMYAQTWQSVEILASLMLEFVIFRQRA